MLNEVGRLCVKLAGRDANKKCVIVDILDDNHVTIDGETRRRKCNIRHLEPLNQVLKLKKGASRAEVKKAFKELGIELKDTKPKKAASKPKKQKLKKADLAPKEPVKKAKPKVVTEKKAPEVKKELEKTSEAKKEPEKAPEPEKKPQLEAKK
jgi:large subunit ribosomal protein L14e